MCVGPVAKKQITCAAFTTCQQLIVTSAPWWLPLLHRHPAHIPPAACTVPGQQWCGWACGSAPPYCIMSDRHWGHSPSMPSDQSGHAHEHFRVAAQLPLPRSWGLAGSWGQARSEPDRGRIGAGPKGACDPQGRSSYGPNAHSGPRLGIVPISPITHCPRPGFSSAAVSKLQWLLWIVSHVVAARGSPAP